MKRIAVSIAVWLIVAAWVVLVGWAYGADLTVRGDALGGVALFAPSLATIVAVFVHLWQSKLFGKE